MDQLEPTTTTYQQIDEHAVARVKAAILDLLAKMGIKGDLASRIQPDDHGNEMLVINIESEDSNLLIGQNGTNLVAFQHLARILAKPKEGGPIHFVVDVNNYRANREQYLHKLAQELAKKVRDSKEKIILKPLSAYERRIIHMTLADEKDIATESIGTEPERRLVIKLANTKDQGDN